ncbi:MAG: hypothetical protein ACRD4F_02565, partial [Candidatus Angelobacter sp.]
AGTRKTETSISAIIGRDNCRKAKRIIRAPLIVLFRPDQQYTTGEVYHDGGRLLGNIAYKHLRQM